MNIDGSKNDAKRVKISTNGWGIYFIVNWGDILFFRQSHLR